MRLKLLLPDGDFFAGHNRRTFANHDTSSDPSIAYLEKRGAATQLIVNGKPYLVLAGETDNTASSSLEYMDPVWPKLVKANLNTVLVGIGWDWIEPVEGKYDFTLVDGLLAGARKNNLHLIFLWFGSWKNGLSSFAPAWVKADQQRFPRSLLKNGKAVEVLSTFSDANLQADTRAYTAFMQHLRKVDSKQHTVVMIQLENEVGLIGDSRDHSADAEAAFAQFRAGGT
jgi:beta-galactosidase GanA